VCHLLNVIINLAAYYYSHPWHHGVEGYLHPDLIDVQAMGLNRATMVLGDRPIIVEVDECVPKHLRKPRAVLARGMKTPNPH
jgi:hypothetical protein